MGVDVEKIEELRRQLVEAEDLLPVWNFFFDHFGENPDFIALGKMARSPLLEEVLLRVGKQLFGEDVRTMGPTLIKLRKYKFLHGSGLINGRLAVLFFFTDLDMGMVSVVDSGGHTHLVRFTTYQMGADRLIRFHPAPSKAVH